MIWIILAFGANFISCCIRIRIRIRNPDPDPGGKFNADTDPDPKHCWRYVHPQNDHVTLRPKRSSPMDRHRAPPISGSWSLGAARAVDGASLLHGPLRVDRTAETENKLNGWTDRAWTQRQGTLSAFILFRAPALFCFVLASPKARELCRHPSLIGNNRAQYIYCTSVLFVKIFTCEERY